MSLEGQLIVTPDRNGVTFSFTVVNPSTLHVQLSFSSRLIVDFVVLEGDNEVWRWSAGKSFDSMDVAESLAPGESFTVTRTWEAARSGEYSVIAELQATNHEVTVRDEFRPLTYL